MKRGPPSAERAFFGVIAAALIAAVPTVAEPADITVQSTEQLIDALAPGPGARTIHVRVGTLRTVLALAKYRCPRSG
jgi:hypothetical protein